jgi:lysophospholipase L1-like esterase
VLYFVVPKPAHFKVPQPLHQPDAELGWTMVRHQDSFTLDQPVHTNSLGLRSPEPLPPASGPAHRIICLGDSQTFGNGVAQEGTFPAVLAGLLQEMDDGHRVEVFNAGVQAYGTEQEVGLLERLIPALEPDAVVLAFYLNDIPEALRQLSADSIDASTGEMARRGTLKSFLSYPTIYLAKRSRVVTLVYERYRAFTEGGDANPAVPILEGRSTPSIDRAWERIDRALERLQLLSRQHGFALIAFPVPESLEFQRAYPQEQYRSRFLARAAVAGLPAFDPTPPLREQGATFATHFVPWDGHINGLTHRFLAEMLAERLYASLHRPAPLRTDSR